MTRLAPILALLLFAGSCGKTPIAARPSGSTRKGPAAVDGRGVAAELWALAPPDATTALVVPDLRAFARLAAELGDAASAAPRGELAIHHLGVFFRAVCPACPREARTLEALGVALPDGLAFFASPRERVLAIGCSNEAPLLTLLEALHRRFDHTVQRRGLARAADHLEVLDGLYPWYCKKAGVRLACANSPATLDAVLARRPGRPGLYEQRVAGRLKSEGREPIATLLVENPLAPALVGLSAEADRITLRALARPPPREVALLSRASRASLLPVLEGAEALARVSLPWAEIDPLVQRARAELEKLAAAGLTGRRRAKRVEAPEAGTTAPLPAAKGKALRESLDGEILVARTGPFRYALLARLRDPERLRKERELVERGLKVMQLAHRFASTGPVRVKSVENETVEGTPVLAVTVEVELGAALSLPVPLSVPTRIYLAIGKDVAVATNDLDVLKRALNPALRRPALPPPGPDDPLLADALSPAALFALHSRILDPFSGIPRPLVDAWVVHALEKDRNLLDLVETVRFLADLSHDLTAWVRPRGDLVETVVVLRSLGLDDAAHRAARAPFLRALRARASGDLGEYRRSLSAVVAAQPTTRYATRARLLLGQDPTSLASLLSGLATLAAGPERGRARKR